MNNASKHNASHVNSVLVTQSNYETQQAQCWKQKVLRKTLLVTWFLVEISPFGLGLSYSPKRIFRLRRKTAKFVRRLMHFIFRNLQCRRTTHADTKTSRKESLHIRSDQRFIWLRKLGHWLRTKLEIKMILKSQVASMEFFASKHRQISLTGEKLSYNYKKATPPRTVMKLRYIQNALFFPLPKWEERL